MELNWLNTKTGSRDEAERIGLRFGDKGTHTSRTMMMEELRAVLTATDTAAGREDFAEAVIEGNILAKPTLSTRRLSNQRLGELYGLSPELPLFRILRRLWTIDEAGRPLLALLTALARDPLLRASAEPVLSLPPGGELNRDATAHGIRDAIDGSRFNDATLAKVVRNVASTWAQSGHLIGRTFKKRQRVKATPAAVALALYLGHVTGFRGADVLSSPWVTVLDCSPSVAQDLAFQAKRLGLIDLQAAGDVFALDTRRLDPWRERI